MGVSYSIEDNIAVVLNYGSFSNETVKKTLIAITRDRDYRPGIHVLFIDRRSEYDPPKEELKEAALILSQMVPRISDRIAIVVETELHYELAKTIQAHCETHGVTFEVFWEEKEARKWLNNDSGD